MARWIIGLTVLLLCGQVNAELITGPTLTSQASGWSDSGLQITALQDVTLESFVFTNEGQADTIWLTDSLGQVLETYSVAGGDTALFVDVDWQLQAGDTYRLISHYERPFYATYNGFPTANSQLQVDGTWFGPGDLLTTNFWFSFNELQTRAVPEPTTFALWGAMSGLGLIAARRRRKVA